MRKRSIQTAAALLLTGCGVSAAQAADSGWYVGVNLGQSKYDLNEKDLSFIIFEGIGSLTNSSFSNTDTAFAAVFGYRVSRYLALEGSYTDLGKLQHRASATLDLGLPLGTVPVTTDIQLSAKGPTLAVVGSLPINPSFDLHARGGVFFSKTKIKIGVSISGQGGSDSVSASSQDFFYGIGVGYTPGAHWAFSADWLEYRNVGDKEKVGEGDIRALTVSGFYRF